MKNRATTNQKHTIDSQKPKRREHKHKIKSSNHKRKKKGTKKKHRINWKTRFKMTINTYVSIITLNVNGLNAPIKRQSGRLEKKQEPMICCLQATDLKAKDIHRLKVRGWKKIFHANGNDKKAGVAILISDKIDFKTKAIKKDKEGHYVMVKDQYKKRILHSTIHMHLICMREHPHT